MRVSLPTLCASGLLAVIPVGAVAASDAAEVSIPWRTGAIAAAPRSSVETAIDLALLAARPDERHAIVQFDQPVTDALKSDLAEAGVTLLSYLANNAFFAALDKAHLDPNALAAELSLVRAEPIQPAFKLHPLLADGQAPEYAIVDKLAESPIVAAYVVFHPDVELNSDGFAAAAAAGAVVRDTISVVNGLVIELPLASVAALAADDRVQWIEPPLPRFSEWNDSNRSRIGAATAQAAPYNLTGSGVTVLVYDGGRARATHQDFGGRLFARDSSSLSSHATHVSGTIGGSGAASGGLRKGMAPGVTMQSYGFQYDGTGIFLYTNPGDLQADYNQAINTYGADISNNSIGTNTETNGFSCSIQGDYGVTDQLIDNIVRGSLGAPFRIVWAAGNERQGSRCDVEGYGDYYSTAPPATAKNHITVGALNSNNDSMTSFSSWGPTDDGRMKPDVAGPGCQSDSDFGVTSCSSTSDTAYTTMCGTSMAAPSVTGACALLLEDYRTLYGPADPRNSTLKILLAHTAVDLGNVGPDYQYGYGSVRIVSAIDFMRSGQFAESTVSAGGVVSYTVNVAAGTPQLKVTLAWDDPAGTPNVSPALINDLDLRVYDPGNVQRYPWTLNPTSPSSPAVQTARNSRDNIEQVLVNSPATGTWRVEVHGYNVPQGPQPFSICATPGLGAGGPCDPPPAPTGVSAADGASCTDVVVTWTASAGATSYSVLRNTLNDGGSATPIGTTGGTSFSDTTGAAGTVYYYFVTAGNSCGTSAPSASDTGYRNTDTTAAPLNVAATDGTSCTQISVSWDAVAGATSYQIWRSTSNDSGTATQIATDSNSPYGDGTPIAGTTYYYWVKAVGACGTSGFSNGDAGTRAASTVLPPTGVTASDATSCAAVTVSWTASAGATGYQIWRSTTNSSATATQIATDSASPYDDTTAAQGTTYYYWVKATDACGASGFSNGDAGSRASGSTPSAPGRVRATDGTYCDRVRVTWNGVSGATAYDVYRNTTNNSATAVLIGSSATTTYDDFSVTAGVTYHYWVKARNACATSGFSNRNTGYRAVCP
jgi:subtilisin family serine protease/fibronectin type 3 domain-containing protein